MGEAKRRGLAYVFHSRAYHDRFMEDFGGDIDELCESAEVAMFAPDSKGGALLLAIDDDSMESFLLDCSSDDLLWRFLYAGLKVQENARRLGRDVATDYPFLLWDVVSCGDAFSAEFDPRSIGGPGRSPELEAALVAVCQFREPVLTGELAARFAVQRKLCEFECDALFVAAELVPPDYAQTYQ